MNSTEQTAPRAPRKARQTKSSSYYSLEDAQEMEQGSDIHGDDYGDYWETQRNLPMPEPRPGFVDRWVRIGVNGATDHKNIRNKLKRGYRPRPPSSVTNMPVSKMGDDEVIGDENNCLMERPIAIERKERAAMKVLAKNQMQEVHSTVYKSGKGGGGFGGIQYAEDKTTARSGRPAPIDDDPAFG